MPEYIEREKVLSKAVPVEGCFSDMISAYDVIMLPAADVAPVRHGQWEKQSGLYSCSECGKTCPYDVQADVIEYWTCNYCPKCGAKMDLEDEEDNNANKKID